MGNNGAIVSRRAKKKIPDGPGTGETPCIRPNKSGIHAVSTKAKVTPLISPPPLKKQQPRSTKSLNSGSLGVNELLQVFLELEELR